MTVTCHNVMFAGNTSANILCSGIYEDVTFDTCNTVCTLHYIYTPNRNKNQQQLNLILAFLNPYQRNMVCDTAA